jgi:hypothetical protein
MWAITSYFNPVRYKRRLLNYRVFRANLGLPLVTVELGFDGEFELRNEDADILVKLDGGAVLWQKERLLNIAIRAVPGDVENVAWLDCDVVLQRPYWIEAAEKQLESLNIIQLYSESAELRAECFNPAPDPRVCHYTPGIMSLFADSSLPTKERWQAVDKIRPKQLGFAWAGKRSLLQDRTFYDAAILGGGDALMFLAMFGLFEAAIRRSLLNEASRNHFSSWALSYNKAVAGRAGYLPGKIYHLWHGDRKNRQYKDRYRLLRDFDPYSDIVVGGNGAWQWKEAQSELARLVQEYFMERAEDG